MPIHIRAEPGEYADACLLPGDPLRAKYIAETYFDNPVQRNGERGMRDLCRLLLERLPLVCLFVRAENAPAIRVYEAIGMRRTISYRSLIF